jgi:iron(III) transport system substrate-binding protein
MKLSYGSMLSSGALALGLLIPALGAAATVEEVAKYSGADRQAFLEAGAKKEGQLTLLTVGTQIQPVIKGFTDKYPYIRTQMAQIGNNTEIVRKVLEEYKVAHYTGDGLELASGGLTALREAGVLQAFNSPESVNYDKDSMESTGLWISVRESYGGIGYNTKIFPPAEAPKTWDDLLKPQYKGKMGVTNSESIAGLWIGALVLDKGEDFVRKLGANDVKLFNLSSRAIADLTVTGEVPISARASDSHFAESKAKGSPVEYVDPGSTAVTDTSVAVLAKAPHPHAMILMADFLLSRQGQQLYKSIGYSSARRDMIGSDAPKKKYYLERRPNFFQEFDHWIDLFHAAFKNKQPS